MCYSLPSLSPPRSLPALLTLAVLPVLASCGAPEPTPEQKARRDSLQALPPMERLPEGEAGDLVRRAIEAHGGWEAWSELETVSYRKATIRLNEDGEVTDSTVAHHRYALHPGPKMHIGWTDEDGRRVTLMNDGDEAWKFVDGEHEGGPMDQDQAWNSTFGSHYVFAQPFKLTDPGANLTHLGRDTLPDGTPVVGLRVTYDPGVGSAGGMHTWVYYFHPESGRLAAYRFGEGDEVDRDVFTRHSDYREVGGVLLYGRRTAYRSGEDSLWTSSVYLHQDHRANVSLSDSLFLPPERRDG